WRDSYHWKHKEEELNQYHQFNCEIEVMTICFFRSSAAYAAFISHSPSVMNTTSAFSNPPVSSKYMALRMGVTKSVLPLRNTSAAAILSATVYSPRRNTSTRTPGCGTMRITTRSEKCTPPFLNKICSAWLTGAD
ncbi:MAG: epoxide hydrolase N-terminal domain-containing protein, partial [Oscillibacter sp.]|nr:epoxide hydrolase N-terminal domain-containing protein [Oscillibacter sp.]